ncbi:MAG: hypothetical protein V6Z82_06630, partial [Flavobacteriales bacterium]
KDGVTRLIVKSGVIRTVKIYVYIPDREFRDYLKGRFKKAFLGERLDPDDPSIKKAKEIYVTGKGIRSLKGIEYFPELRKLTVSDNKLKSLDISENKKLYALNCHKNQLTELDISQNKALRYLSCSSNSLTQLNISSNEKLTKLWCSGNQLTQLDLSKNTALQVLGCKDNRLTQLDLSKNTELKRLECYGNALSYLDATGFRHEYDDAEGISKPFEIYYDEQTQKGKLKTLKINKLLRNYAEIREIKSKTPDTQIMIYDDEDQVFCSDYAFKTGKFGSWYYDRAPHGTCLSALVDTDRRLMSLLKQMYFPADYSAYWGTKLDSTNKTIRSVKYINTNNWKVSSLKGIAAFTELETLCCSNNNLGSLDVSQNKKLKKLVCLNCNLEHLNISQNKALLALWCAGNALRQLDVSANEDLVSLWCSSNRLGGLHLEENTHLVQLWCYSNPLKALNMTGLHKGSTADLEKWSEMTQLPADRLENEKYRRLRIYTRSKEGEIDKNRFLKILKIDKQFKNHYEIRTIKRYSPDCKIFVFPR